MRALIDQAQREGGLVDVIVVALANLGEGLDADGELFAGHGERREINAAKCIRVACRTMDHPTTKSVYSSVGTELNTANWTAASASVPSAS